MARCSGGNFADELRLSRRSPPALRAIPFDQLLSRKLKRAGDRGHRETPQGFTARGACILEQEEFIALIANASPPLLRAPRFDPLAAQFLAGCRHRGTRAA